MTVRITIAFGDKEKAGLDQASKASERTINALVREAVREWLKCQEVEQ